MKLLKFILLAMAITLCCCSEKEVLDYEIPELSLTDLTNMLGTSKEDFVSQFPYSVPNKSSTNYSYEEIKSYFADEPNGVAHNMSFRFYDDRCTFIDFGEYIDKQAIDRYLLLVDIVNTYSNNLRLILIVDDTDNDTSTTDNLIKFYSIKDLKDWIENEFDTSTKTISTIWNSPNDDINNNIHLVYSKVRNSENVSFSMGR